MQYMRAFMHTLQMMLMITITMTVMRCNITITRHADRREVCHADRREVCHADRREV